MALDPEIWLHARLTYGRLGLLLPLAGILVAVSVAGAVSPSGMLQGLMLTAAYLVLVASPLPAVDRLMQWERDGRLDQHRLADRRPGWILAAPFLASMLPPAALSAAAIAIDHAAHPDAEIGNDPWVAGIFLLVSVTGALAAFALAPLAPSPAMAYLGSWGVLIATTLLADVAGFSDWRLAAAGVFSMGLAVAAFAATRRVAGTRGAGVARSRRSGIASIAWRLPIPPESARALAYVLASRSTHLSLLGYAAAALALGLGDAEVRAEIAPLLPFLPLASAVFAISSFGAREVEGGGDDRVRLTPAPPIAIVLSWIAGAALPFWTAAGVVAGIVWKQGAWPTGATSYLALAAATLPALGLANGLRRQRGGVASALLATVFGVTVLGTIVALGEHGDLTWLRQEWIVGSFTTLPLLLAALLVLATAGRLEMPEGPGLSGGLAPAGILATIAIGLPLPIAVQARLVPAMLVLFASLFARGFRGGPARSVMLATAGAGAALAVLWPLGDTGTAIRGAALAGLGFGVALAIQEKLAHRSTLALALRLALAAGVFLAPELLHPSRLTGGTIAGVVRDGGGRPVPAARVEVKRFARDKVLATTTADAAGRFRFGHLETGRYRLVASAGDRSSSGGDVTTALGRVVPLDLSLRNARR